jgi:hypothetical protein
VFDTEASHGVCSGNREVRDWEVDNAVDCLMRAEPFAARLFVRCRGDYLNEVKAMTMNHWYMDVLPNFTFDRLATTIALIQLRGPRCSLPCHERSLSGVGAHYNSRTHIRVVDY